MMSCSRVSEVGGSAESSWTQRGNCQARRDHTAGLHSRSIDSYNRAARMNPPPTPRLQRPRRRLRVARRWGHRALRVARLARAHPLPVVRRARESQGAWKEPGMTSSASRKSAAPSRSARRSARRRGPLLRRRRLSARATDALVEALVQEYRASRPELVLTHAYDNPYNPDHPAANQLSLQARVYAQAEATRSRSGARRPAGVHVRTASAGAVRLQAGGPARRHRRLGEQARRRWRRWWRSSTSSTTTRI